MLTLLWLRITIGSGIVRKIKKSHAWACEVKKREKTASCPLISVAK